MKGLMVHKVCVLMTFMKYNKSFAFYKRLKVINTFKKNGFDRTVIISGL